MRNVRAEGGKDTGKQTTSLVFVCGKAWVEVDRGKLGNGFVPSLQMCIDFLVTMMDLAFWCWDLAFWYLNK